MGEEKINGVLSGRVSRSDERHTPAARHFLENLTHYAASRSSDPTDHRPAFWSDVDKVEALMRPRAELVMALRSSLDMLGLIADRMPLGSSVRNAIEDECAAMRPLIAKTESRS